MDNFITVYEVSKGLDHDSGIGAIAGLIFLMVGIVGIIVQKKRQGSWPKWLSPSGLIVVLGGILFIMCSLFFIGSIAEANRLVSAYETGQYEVVEGIVHVLHRQAYHGHTKGDIIKINGQKLEINYFVDTQAYSQTISRGGVLREGVHARVYHQKGKILRIDVRGTRVEE